MRDYIIYFLHPVTKVLVKQAPVSELTNKELGLTLDQLASGEFINEGNSQGCTTDDVRERVLIEQVARELR